MTKCDQKTSGDNFFFNFMRIREGLVGGGFHSVVRLNLYQPIYVGVRAGAELGNNESI